jgi:hypothetical protein
LTSGIYSLKYYVYGCNQDKSPIEETSYGDCDRRITVGTVELATKFVVIQSTIRASEIMLEWPRLRSTRSNLAFVTSEQEVPGIGVLWGCRI